MINLYLIRHGKAKSGWNSSDPGLDDNGEQQSKKIALELSSIALEPFDILSSPLSRCIQTAEPFCEISKKKFDIEKRIIEIPSPIKNLEKRVIWLKRVLPLTWDQLLADKETRDSGIDFNLWRKNIIKFLLSLKKDTFIFTHYLVINSIISHIKKSNKVVFFNTDIASVTHLSLSDKNLKIILLGKEATTQIN